MRKFFLSFLLLLLIFPGTSFALINVRLSNGVNIITEKMESDVAVLDVWVRVGSRNEGAEFNGISHFIEHLIFKGSKKYKAGEIERLIEESGGIVNAATSKDFTHFYAVVPKQYFNQVVGIIGDALINPLFPDSEIEKERRVVLEEILRSSSQPEEELYDLIYEKSFKFHPYHYPILGNLGSVSFLNRDLIMGYFKRYYAGSNITVVATGGLLQNSTSQLKRAFSGVRRLQTNSFDPGSETLSSNSLLEKKKKISKTYLKIAFSSPPASSFDSYVMDVIITLLGNGRNSRLNKEVKENKELVYEIDVSYPTPIDPNLVIISTVCDPRMVDAAQDQIFKEVNRLKAEAISELELNKVKTMLKVDYLVTHQNPQSLASQLGYYATVAGRADYETKYLLMINRVSSADINRAAKKYLNYYTIARFIPE